MEGHAASGTSIGTSSGGGEAAAARLLAAAADPIRYRILGLLRVRDHSVGELCEALQMAQPRVSHHLGLLRRSGLVQVQSRGRRRLYRWAGPAASGRAGELLSLLERWLDAKAPSPTAGSAGDRAPLEDFLL